MQPIFALMGLFWKDTERRDRKRLAAQTPTPGVEQIRDLPYIDDGSRYHRLDVYFPEKRDGACPVIVDIHGGGWMYAEKELNRNYCLSLAGRGFTVFNISYRLTPEVTVNGQLRDVMQALRWIDGHLGDFPCRTDAYLLTGDSAGGQLAAYAAALTASARLRERFGVVEVERRPNALLLTSPVAYMNVGGPIGLYGRAMWGASKAEKATLAYQNLDSVLKEAVEDGGYPPTMLLTSSGDLLGHAQTRRAARDMESLGIPTRLLDFPRTMGKPLPHVFSVLEPDAPPSRYATDEALRFFLNAVGEK